MKRLKYACRERPIGTFCVRTCDWFVYSSSCNDCVFILKQQAIYRIVVPAAANDFYTRASCASTCDSCMRVSSTCWPISSVRQVTFACIRRQLSDNEFFLLQLEDRAIEANRRFTDSHLDGEILYCSGAHNLCSHLPWLCDCLVQQCDNEPISSAPLQTTRQLHLLVDSRFVCFVCMLATYVHHTMSETNYSAPNLDRMYGEFL